MYICKCLKMKVMVIDLRSQDVNKEAGGKGDAEMQVPLFISFTERGRKVLTQPF